MKRVMLMLACALGLAGAASPAPAPAAPCGRTCLAGLLNTYLTGLVAHAPDKAGLAFGFRQTQNAVVIPRGEGLWKEASALGTLQRRFFDPTSATAAYFGTLILQGGETAIVSLRMHQSGGKVDEAEWHVARATDAGIQAGAKATLDIANLLAHPPGTRLVAAKDRLPRADLLAITNSYFDGITAENARVIRAHKGCNRLENGMGAPPGAKDEDGGPPDCMSGQGKFGVAFVAGRRFPMVDEEAQVVLAIGTFVRKPGNPKRRNQFMEFFYIDHAKIREVYAAYFFADPALPVPNWPPYEGNFPLPADFGPAK